LPSNIRQWYLKLDGEHLNVITKDYTALNPCETFESLWNITILVDTKLEIECRFFYLRSFASNFPENDNFEAFQQRASRRNIFAKIRSAFYTF